MNEIETPKLHFVFELSFSGLAAYASAMESALAEVTGISNKFKVMATGLDLLKFYVSREASESVYQVEKLVFGAMGALIAAEAGTGVVSAYFPGPFKPAVFAAASALGGFMGAFIGEEVYDALAQYDPNRTAVADLVELASGGVLRIDVYSNAPTLHATVELFRTLSPSLSDFEMEQILWFAAADRRETLSGTVNALGKLLLGKNFVPATSNDGNSLLRAVAKIQEEFPQNIVIEPTSSWDPLTLALMAKTDLAARYVLTHPASFIVWGAENYARALESDVNLGNYELWLRDDYRNDKAAALSLRLALNEEGAADSMVLNHNKAIPLVGEAIRFTNEENVAIELKGTFLDSPATDVMFAAAKGGVLRGQSGEDRLYGGVGNDVLDGGSGSDSLVGGAGEDWLGFRAIGLGNESQEEINSVGNAFDGGTGNDKISGSKGNDRYLFRKGDGQDFVQTQGGADELRLIARAGDIGPDITEAEVSFHKEGLDLQVRVGSANDIVTLMGWFDPQAGGSKRLATVTLGLTSTLQAGDKVWTEQEITELAEAGASTPLFVEGTDAADVLQAPSGQAVALHGLGGNDTLHGSSQDDFLYGGAGDDILYGNRGLDVLNGAEDKDGLYGGDDDDYLMGGPGNDVLDGGRGRDYLYGGDDNDTLGGGPNSADAGYYRTSYPPYGYQDPGAGNVYVGSRGNDLLRGTSHADLYLFDLGDGHDTIEEPEVTDQPSGQEDILRFGEGITPIDITVARSNTHLVLSHANGTDKVTIKNWYTSVGATKNQIERVEFFDGTVWLNHELSERGLTVHGTEGDDILAGLGVHPFPDALLGNGGADSLYGYAGHDKLLGGNGDDQLYGGDDKDELYGGEGRDLLDGGRGQDWLEGGAGNDTLGGGAGSSDAGFFRTSYAPTGYQDPGAGNTYVGGTGNDLLRGTSRADLYLFNLGDGQDTLEEAEITGQAAGEIDVLRFGSGINPEDLSVRRVGTDLVLEHVNGTDKVTFKKWFSVNNGNQVERIEFEAGPNTVWDNHALSAQALIVQGGEAGESLVGVNYYANTLYGGGGGDTLYGGNLGDQLFGGTGNDTLYGGLGDDIYPFFHGDGRDTVLDTGGAADRVVFHDITAEMAQFFRQGNDLVINIGGSTTQGVTVRNQFSITENQMEFFDFQNGALTWQEIQLMGVPFQ